MECHLYKRPAGPVANFLVIRMLANEENLPLPMLLSASLVLNAIAEKPRRQSRNDFQGRRSKPKATWAFFTSVNPGQVMALLN